MDAGETDEGLRQFETAITLSDNDPFIIYQIGTACYDNGEYDLAYDALRRITIETRMTTPSTAGLTTQPAVPRWGARMNSSTPSARDARSILLKSLSYFPTYCTPIYHLLIYTNSSKTNL